ncbi:MAG TPA: Mut7-C RNAse domain-containing protein [Trebonia sp.]|nr:Mut7-C RNAse domain-containing protein [Trebonia sp.]
MDRPEAEVRFDAELRMFLAPRHRDGRVLVACDDVSSLGHVVESLGVPLPEIGDLTVNGRPAAPSCRLAAGDVALAGAVRRPQPVPSPRFVLDVHLGTLARRLRLVGVDAAYASDADDDALIERANAGRRVLLTQDRGLLRRRILWLGAYVRGALPDDQLRDVLDRFAPPLAPWTRCTACNGPLAPARKADVEPLLQPGTRRTYQSFSRCLACGRVYWRGAHSRRLQRIVDSALGTVGSQA